MRATWPGATSGSISMTTRPWVISMMRAFSGSLISAIRETPFWMWAGRRLFGVGSELHLHDRIGVKHLAARSVAFFDAVDELHAFDHLAEGGVFAVQMRRRLE